MATIGHIAIGMAAARLTKSPRSRHWAFVLFWIALSMLPDADMASPWFGVPFSAPLVIECSTR